MSARAEKSTAALHAAPVLRGQVIARLRRAIIAGHFPPGGRLVERELCELTGVSRTLIREALRQLEAEGWVLLLPHRGPVVATMTPSQVRELYEVRGALEGLVAQLCAERASGAELERIAKAVETMTKAQAEGDVSAHRRQAVVFYDVLRRSARNEMLRHQLETLNARLEWMRAIALSRPERARVSVQEEQELLAALLARDGAKARSLCERHLQAAAEAVVAGLERAGAA